ncbi:LLM class flavin-dependent oxidoreductase [Paracoccus onubensis]|uniref:LLM class flavin-dependent oxidoreductase n=1 Tax=Paracoccus onubensis TaxID=1675788 RepID=A0A418SUQ0_9RHOB|nr:LLM class flavin-dependent oxidoreductase [Paracoccus onubensis]RJE84608.1 LLM class flavin-dependent oxidoreductase [Paracoccus onubensis]
MREDKIRLGGFLYETGHHIAAWRHPQSDEHGGNDFDITRKMTETLEEAKFDLLFFQDAAGIRDWDHPAACGRLARASYFDAITHAAAVAAVTKHIGIVATASTSFNAPYNIARQFASIDLISQGRVGWNVVTSTVDAEARNYGLDAMARHADRYARAEEFLDVVLSLWNSWEDGALVADKTTGRYFETDRVRPINHEGQFFKVRGPLNVSRSPQGQPVIVQAGASDVGRQLGARTAEVIFTASPALADAQEFYGDVKERMKSYGRQESDLAIMPGFMPVVGATEEEARAKYQELQDLMHPDVGTAYLSRSLGLDLSKFDPDGPIPDVPMTEGGKSRQQLIVQAAQREKLTIRQLYLRIVGARGHALIVGTPAQIVDEMEERFMIRGADGFNIMPPTLPGGLLDFCNLVVPELRKRGLAREKYTHKTLRGNLQTKPGITR